MTLRAGLLDNGTCSVVDVAASRFVSSCTDFSLRRPSGDLRRFSQKAMFLSPDRDCSSLSGVHDVILGLRQRTRGSLVLAEALEIMDVIDLGVNNMLHAQNSE